MPSNEQRWAGEEPVETVLASVKAIAEFRTTASNSILISVPVVTHWAGASIVIMGRQDEAVVPYGLIFEVEPVATNNEIERIERECKVSGLRRRRPALDWCDSSIWRLSADARPLRLELLGKSIRCKEDATSNASQR